MTGVLGTFHWMAPEIFESKPYSTKADIYSFGVYNKYFFSFFVNIYN